MSIVIFSNIPGCTDLAEHDIELESERAIVVKPYRMSLRQIEILKSEVNKMEARPCIDYRRLNKVTRTQFFPLPDIEELLEKVSAAKYISILDLTRGYWQIPLSPRAQRYASFVTTFGTFKSLKLPYGLTNAPYYFSRLMANLLRNCEDFAVPYLDDIAIFSLAWDDHLKHLKDVFDRLRSAKLHIKPSKCQFAQAYVKYLGHLVGQVIAAPLTDLLKGRNRKSTVGWNSSCQNAFEELKTRLSKNPVLCSPDFTKPFIIQCDASNLEIGVVLSQGSRFLYPHDRAGWACYLNQCSCKETTEALSASPPTSQSILTDYEDKSVVIPPAKRSKHYNPPAMHAMAFILAIPG
ncbi:retrovirus-related Pol polyprotein from transposon 17.6 [Trichonephila clavipes]|uniref:Retrovirus-related Pol polyprotein from transposon 17.6 n=1 Tax=Trichonephila clavipes TaxID=2585209 RepID=A0A8X7BHP4_TRICX|nr:retrovirus-related Pol polyprotein from transposon 17.6 [Trichonephila clavipes]